MGIEQQNSPNASCPNQAYLSNSAPLAPLAALCAIARLHQIAADPATLAHQLGLLSSEQLASDDLLRAAKHLGLVRSWFAPRSNALH